jgi:hypothetical protein
MIDRLLSAFRQSLVLLAALSFVLSGMSAAHTMHALAGDHETRPNVATDQDDSHCDGHKEPAKQSQDKALSCCASACTPFMVLIEPLNLALDACHGEAVLPARQDVIVAGNFALPFRPPRQNA